jgi:hypothetical protein
MAFRCNKRREHVNMRQCGEKDKGFSDGFGGV